MRNCCMIFRMHTQTDPTVRTTISLPQSLAEKAKQHQVSLSQYVQETLPEYIKRRDAELWIERNKQGIEEYNALVRKHGCLLKDQGTW